MNSYKTIIIWDVLRSIVKSPMLPLKFLTVPGFPPCEFIISVIF